MVAGRFRSRSNRCERRHLPNLTILAISGSLRARSTNTELLLALSALAPEGVSIDLYDALDRLPHFNPDLEHTEPAPVMDLKRRLGRSDGLIISSPEYARGVPGSLKNALDWLVSGSEFVDKPVALVERVIAFDLRVRGAANHADDHVGALRRRRIDHGAVARKKSRRAGNCGGRRAVARIARGARRVLPCDRPTSG